jgi:hypothetical protein
LPLKQDCGVTSTIKYGMSKTPEKRREILSEMDQLLSDHGFKRKKSSFDWHKTLNEEITQSINMGIVLYPRAQGISVNPNVSVRYESIEQAIVEAGIVDAAYLGERATFGQGINNITRKTYWIAADDTVLELTRAVYEDILKYGFPSLEKLSDITQVIKMLSSGNVQDWAECDASGRARLLPLALAVNGKSVEALTLIPALAKELKGRDQMIPNYQHFTAWFSQKYSTRGIIRP